VNSCRFKDKEEKVSALLLQRVSPICNTNLKAWLFLPTKDGVSGLHPICRDSNDTVQRIQVLGKGFWRLVDIYNK
jgi:hypothetical protein